MDNSNRETIKRFSRILKVICSAFIISQGAYIFVLTQVAGTRELMPEEGVLPLQIALGVGAVTMLVAAFIVPNIMIKAQKKVETLYMANVIRFALIEGAGVLGFVFGMQSGKIIPAIPFFVIAIVALIVSMPTVPKLESQAQSNGIQI